MDMMVKYHPYSPITAFFGLFLPMHRLSCADRDISEPLTCSTVTYTCCLRLKDALTTFCWRE